MDRYLKLMSKDLGHRLSPEAILSFGDQAAKMHVDGGLDLTDAVLQVIRGKMLNPAHVCRITEMANQNAYLLLYERCGGPSRPVTFEGGPARVFEILEKTFAGVLG